MLRLLPLSILTAAVLLAPAAQAAPAASATPIATAGPAPAAAQGYYDGVDDSNATTLRTTLHALIDDHQRYPYTSSSPDTWDVLELADQDPANTQHILDLYKNASYAKQGGGNTFYNREHTWPNSYGFPNDGADNYPYTDCHQLFLCDVGYNGARDRLPFAEASASAAEYPTVATNGQGGGSGVYPGNSNWATGAGPFGSFEVWHDRRGDVARALFYLDVRYEGGSHAVTGHAEPDLILTDDHNLIAASATGSNESLAHMGLLTTLLAWHDADPPDARELARNDVVHGFQGNRNPFVDHPEWVACLWANDCGSPELTADRSSLDLATGGTVTLSLDAGFRHRNRAYRVLGSTEGTSPGFVHDGVLIPLEPQGFYFRDTVAQRSPYLSGDAGTLDANGLGSAAFTLPGKLPPWLDGWLVSHAFVVLDASGTAVVDASNAVNVALAAGSGGSADLVVNEIDYDQPGSDTEEFVEITNRGSAPADLNGAVLELWNGSGTVLYDSIDLSAAGSTLAPGAHLVIGTATVVATLPPGTPAITFAAAQDNLQNGGSNGDGMRLLRNGQLLDSLSYEAYMSGFTEGFGHAGIDSSSGTQSLARLPDGVDTDQNADDFTATTTVTPGAANQ